MRRVGARDHAKTQDRFVKRQRRLDLHHRQIHVVAAIAKCLVERCGHTSILFADSMGNLGEHHLHARRDSRHLIHLDQRGQRLDNQSTRGLI